MSVTKTQKRREVGQVVGMMGLNIGQYQQWSFNFRKSGPKSEPQAMDFHFLTWRGGILHLILIDQFYGPSFVNASDSGCNGTHTTPHNDPHVPFDFDLTYPTLQRWLFLNFVHANDKCNYFQDDESLWLASSIVLFRSFFATRASMGHGFWFLRIICWLTKGLIYKSKATILS